MTIFSTPIHKYLLNVLLISLAFVIFLQSFGQIFVTLANDSVTMEIWRTKFISTTDAGELKQIDMIADIDCSEIINPHNFRYLLNEPNICKRRKSDIFLITFVHSAPLNYKRRILIRETWGNPKFYPDVKNVVLFALGATIDPKIQVSLQLESDRFHDIIQEDFIDAYRNLTYKAILWLKWISYNCAEVKFVVKVDDDIFVNIFHLSHHLSQLYRRQISHNSSILCLSWDGMPVVRDNSSKWYVSPDDYFSNRFSIYCSGSAYIITSDLIVPMFKNSLRSKFFWIDDFYVTGLLTKGLNVTYVDLKSLYALQPDQLENKLLSGYGIFGHVGSLAKRYSMWKRILKMRNLL